MAKAWRYRRSPLRERIDKTMANWTDLQIQVSIADLEQAEAIAQMASPYGFYTEDYSQLEEEVLEIAHIDLIDEELLQKSRDTAVIHLYLNETESLPEAAAFLSEHLTAAGIAFTTATGNLEEKDFATEWRKYYHPIQISPRLAICPTWEEFTPAPGQTVIHLDPGMAFGTGTHDTTRLCLRLIDRYLRPESRVLDVGCGSGILAISALLLGAAWADGCDIDALAVKTARENAEVNGVESRCNFLKADLTQGLSGRYDLICANIVADVIIRLLPDVPRYLSPGGRFIASGIVDVRKQDVLDALEQHGFTVETLEEEGGWVCLAAHC